MPLLLFGRPLAAGSGGSSSTTAGPFAPAFAPVPVTAGKVFPYLYAGAGATWKHTYGLGVMGSVNGDSIWRTSFLIRSGVLPNGVPTLRLWARANGLGIARVNVKWAMCAAGADPSIITLIAEGVQSITWAAGDQDKFKLTSTVLDATTVLPGQMLLMDLVYETIGWTLPAVSVWLPFIEFV